MIYEFRCPTCQSRFEVRQGIFDTHEALCPKCKTPAQRIYSSPIWILADSVFRPDGSLREDKDYAPVMRG